MFKKSIKILGLQIPLWALVGVLVVFAWAGFLFWTSLVGFGITVADPPTPGVSAAITECQCANPKPSVTCEFISQDVLLTVTDFDDEAGECHADVTYTNLTGGDLFYTENSAPTHAAFVFSSTTTSATVGGGLTLAIQYKVEPGPLAELLAIAGTTVGPFQFDVELDDTP